jgi:hypothetical protein
MKIIVDIIKSFAKWEISRIRQCSRSKQIDIVFDVRQSYFWFLHWYCIASEFLFSSLSLTYLNTILRSNIDNNDNIDQIHRTFSLIVSITILIRYASHVRLIYLLMRLLFCIDEHMQNDSILSFNLNEWLFTCANVFYRVFHYAHHFSLIFTRLNDCSMQDKPAWEMYWFYVFALFTI